MKFLLFLKSKVWLSWGRWTRCFTVAAPIAGILFLFFGCFGVCFEYEKILMIFGSFLFLMLLLLLNFMFRPDWYAKIKYDDGRTVYFAVFGTRYLYQGSLWLKGRFVRFSYGDGFDAFNVLKVFKSQKTVLLKTVMDGYVAYYPNEHAKKFIGSQFMGCDFLYDDRKSIRILCTDRLVTCDYDGEACLHYWLYGKESVSYRNIVTNEVYDDDVSWNEKFDFSFFNICLALRQKDGTFKVYVLLRKYWQKFGLVCQVSGAELEDPVMKRVYVPDDKDSSVYHLKK